MIPYSTIEAPTNLVVDHGQFGHGRKIVKQTSPESQTPTDSDQGCNTCAHFRREHKRSVHT